MKARGEGRKILEEFGVAGEAPKGLLDMLNSLERLMARQGPGMGKESPHPAGSLPAGDPAGRPGQSQELTWDRNGLGSPPRGGVD